MKTCITAALIFLFLTCQLAAQKKDTVLFVPGANQLQSLLLSDYTNKYDFFSVKDGAETLTGSLEDNFTTYGTGKNKQALRTCRIVFGTNTILDSGLCELNGLKPVYHRSVQTKKILHLDFSNNIVSGDVVLLSDDNKKEQIHCETAVPLFDSYYEDIIAKSLKFEPGTVFRFPEYIYERGGIVWSWGEITGSAEMNDAGNKITACTIRFYETNPAKEIIRTTVYQVNEQNREIISREYVTANGRTVMRKRVV